MLNFFEKINLKKLLKYLLFMFLVLITQNTLFTQLRLFGVCPLLLPSAAVTPLLQFRTPLTMVDTTLGTRDRMPANRMMEMPLPTPNSLTCSPIHITKEEPAMKETMMTRAGQTPSAPSISRL